MATLPRHSLLETIHTTFGTPRLLGNPSHTLRTVVIKTVGKLFRFKSMPPNFMPRSHCLHTPQ